jgi:ubiquinone/menaquinone biosynthesis C-methylase UbiE
MTIRRTNKISQKKYLIQNKNLKILDLGCTHVNYWEEANHYADIVDYSKEFEAKKLKFTLLYPNKKLPFRDKEFDYVILSHVLEHVPNILEFTKEIERISKSGYIEVPTKLADNLVFGCDEEDVGHKWWLEFDDEKSQLKFTKKIDVLQKFLSVGSINKFQKFFDDSLTLKLYWENNINLVERENYEFDKKITFFSLIRKFLGKKLRDFLSNIKNIFKF